MPTPIAIAVVEHEGRFLIGQRPEGVPLAGLWEFPGGKVAQGETPEAAAARECLEEAGLAIQPLFRYPETVQHYEHDRVRLIFVGCGLVSTELGQPRQPFCWVRREELSHHAFPEGNRGILAILAGAPN
jgi:8-oxo-dGTP diphosphatase